MKLHRNEVKGIQIEDSDDEAQAESSVLRTYGTGYKW